MKISVITATWNCEETIDDCLSAVEAQSYSNIEHLLIDGASSDGTMHKVQARLSQLATVLSEPDKGIYDALNKGIALATGDIVGFLHSDDLFAHPEVLTHIAEVFESDPSVCAVYGDLNYVHKDDTAHVVRRWASKPFTPRRLAWGWMPPHPSLYVRREWYAYINGFDTRYHISADYHSILQLFSHPDFKAVHLPEVLIKMRLGGVSNRSLKAILCKSWEDLDALKRTGVGAFGGFGALLWKNLSKIGQFRFKVE